MAISLVGTPASGGGTSSTLTVSITVPSGTKVLVVAAQEAGNDSDVNTGSCTYNGGAMTLKRSRGVDLTGTNDGRAYLFYINNPTTGTHDIVFTCGDTTPNANSLQASCWDGVDVSGDPFEASNDATGTIGAPSVSVTTVNNNAVAIDSMMQQSGNAVTVDASQTLIAENENVGGSLQLSSGSSYEANPTAGAVTMSWNDAAGADWIIVAGALKEAAGSETASVSPVVATFSVPSVTATSESVLSASVSPVVATFAVTSTTATYIEVDTASVSPVVATFSVPSVTANEDVTVFDASVAPVVATFSVPAVTAVELFTFDAIVSPVVATFSVPTVTAFDPNYILSETFIAPVQGEPLESPRFLFIVESLDGTSFRYATENWEFDTIVREINGSMSVRIKTDQLTADIANSITNLMNRITIRIKTPNTSSSGIVYFTGYIPDRSLNLQPDNMSIEFYALGYASRFADVVYRDGTTIAMDFTTANGGTGETASNIAKDVITKVRAIDTTFPANYTSTSVEDSVDLVKDKFVLAKAIDVLNKAAFLAFDTNRIWHWTLLGDNVFRFKKNATTSEHHFTYGYDVMTFPKFSEELLQAKNEIYVVYNGGANVKRVADSSSITEYGVRGEVINENNIPDSTTATEIGNAHLASKIPPIRSITVTIGSNYPEGIENIDPGDTCRIDNLPPDIAALLTKNMFIVRTHYMRDVVVLELSLKNPFIQNEVDAIRRRLETESVSGIAAITYT